MKPERLFESLCPPGRDACPLLPVPAQRPDSDTWAVPCQVCTVSGDFSPGLENPLSKVFEILPEELRYLRHPHQRIHTALHENEVIV